MSDTYRNQIYYARMNTLMAAGMTEDDAHDTVKQIMASAASQYEQDEALRKRMQPAEDAGRILDIYNSMYTEDRIKPFLVRGMEQREAIELSIRLHDTEKIVIEKFDRENGDSLKTKRDELIEQGGKALLGLKPYINDGQSIEDTMNMMLNSNMPKPLAGKFYVKDALAIPLNRESSMLKDAQTFDVCREQLDADGMPYMIADLRIVEAAIEAEQAKAVEESFTDGVESIADDGLKLE